MRPLLFAIVVAMVTPAAAANAETESAPERACFASNTWDAWSTAKDGDALYLRVRSNDIYRVELTPGSRVRRGAGEFLISEVRGSNMICSALELDLVIADQHGFRRPLFPNSLRRLTAEEIAALTPNETP